MFNLMQQMQNGMQTWENMKNWQQKAKDQLEEVNQGKVAAKNQLACQF